MNTFQTILVAVFLSFFVFAVLIFSGLINIGGLSKDSALPQGKIIVWGTFPATEIPRVFEDISATNKDLIITYIQKPESTYQQSLIEAFANGTGPDLFFITAGSIVKNENFLYKLPFANYPEKTFRDAFIDGADVFIAPDGVLGFPVVVDPMMLYYNRDLLSNEGIAQPPQYWNDLFSLNNRLTKKNADGSINQSMIALGLFDTIDQAKDILATLFLQGGNPLMVRTESGYRSTFDGSTALSTTPLVAGDVIVDFFTEFSDPTNESYSWNRTLPRSRDMFAGGKLALYLGRASDLFTIQSMNPNLSFDVTRMLQTRGLPTTRTYGEIYAIAINKKSANLSTAFTVAGLMTTGEFAKNIASALSLPPASRALLADKPANSPYLFSFFESALTVRTWVDPDPIRSGPIFSELISNVVSNAMQASEALIKANGQMDLLVGTQTR
ncbi:MAG: extracellular solute-binding protein [Candidatus Pacebacteria bacterium]|jgi:ABC-type glycerol-3-phosphate transport system substrate-binding protein|nr:extracellular solute-binding protein [Candidatus Paceibacterota bacterium]